MPEDWSAIAAEVDAALRSVADVSQAAGFPVALRSVTQEVGSDAWNPTQTPSYATIYGVSFEDRVRDADGTLIRQTMRTLTVSAIGAVPNRSQQVAIGVTAEQVDKNSAWQQILEVRPLAPAGVAVLYEIDLAS